jgi:threonine/homoserine/homoserine lactone efflux protein
MTPGVLLALVGFIFACSVTPGPNNAMLLASGVNFGFRRTLPHMAGIALGCAVMVLLVGMGLGEVFATMPALYAVLRYVGAAYLLWLAWRIARADPLRTGEARGRPMSLLAAAAFQWANPKAWVMVVGAVTTYTPRQDFRTNVLLVALLFVAVNVPSIAVWAGFGTAMRHLLDRPWRVRLFNRAMALLLVLSLFPILEG